MDEPSPARQLGSDAPKAMGKYSPFARLDSGGMADVFVAVARGPAGFNKLAVIKRLRNAGDPAHVRMFLDEARISARLSHPNVVNTYEVGESNGAHFMAMEYLDGQPLEALLAKLEAPGGGLSEPLVAFIGVQALKALQYAHELRDYDGTPLGIVHRDVSPQNLFVTYGGEVKLLDFGIAKASVNHTRTETGVLKGKIRYMAPEQVGERDLDRRVDLFALGVVLWEMLARRRLFEGDSFSMLTAIANTDAPRVRSVRPEVSPELDAIVARALQRGREERYAAALEMQGELEAFLRGKGEGLDVELARLMNAELAEKRDKVRARIQAFLSGLESRTTESSADDLGDAADLLPPLLGEGSGPRRSPVPKSTASLRPSHTSARTTSLAARPRASRFAVPGVIAALGVVGVVAFVALHGGAAPTPAPAPTTTSPVAAAPPPEAAPVHVESTPPAAPIEASAPAASAAPAPPPSTAAARHPRAANPKPPPVPSASASAAPHLNIRVLDDDNP